MTVPKPNQEVFERAFLRWRTETLRRLTIGEFPVYEEHLYSWLITDSVRMRAYKDAIGRVVSGRRVIDLGSGAHAPLAVLCAEAGAQHIDAVEICPSAAEAARTHVKSLGLDSVITVHEGAAESIDLRARADVCVSDLIGNIGSSEGAMVTLRDAGRLMRPNALMIPGRCVTWFAPAMHAKSYYRDEDVEAVSEYYRQAIYSAVGYEFSLTRFAIFNFPRSLLLAEEQPFEVLDFYKATAWADDLTRRKRKGQFGVTRSGILQGFILWIELYVDSESIVDAWSDSSWAPVFLDMSGIVVDKDDVIEVECTTQIGANGVNPDYRLEGIVRHSVGGISPFCIDSPHIGAATGLCLRS